MNANVSMMFVGSYGSIDGGAGGLDPSLAPVVACMRARARARLSARIRQIAPRPSIVRRF